ncbi:Putative expansin-B14 [Linum perenne]
MDHMVQRPWSPLITILFLIQLFSSINYCLAHNKTKYLDAVATWYGPSTGGGSTGGACGYCDSVEKAPLNKLIAAGGDTFFMAGKGCGSCYKVKCKSNPDCSKRPVNIVITDQCPSTNEHFDMSGHAFGAMALPGKEESLRCAGRWHNLLDGVQICKFRRVDTNGTILGSSLETQLQLSSCWSNLFPNHFW